MSVFVDQTQINIFAGNGGDGMLSFHRARNRPKLGPDGGNGGIGGDVYLYASKDQNTLSTLKRGSFYRADHGGRGGPNNRTGLSAPPKMIAVPAGTIVYDAETGARLGELLAEGDRLAVAKGGRRGYGNLHFVKATDRAPRKFTHGQPGESRTLRLDLKLLADVGLAGFPNSGKSSLLASLSAAKPKIADYPFTTLVPQLGVVETNYRSFVMADVPGLISGASQGKGLGHRFLRHLERTKLIVLLIDSSDPEPVKTLTALETELAGYGLGNRRKLILLSKSDLVQGEEVDKAGLGDYEVLTASAHTRQGLEVLKLRLADLLFDSESASES